MERLSRILGAVAFRETSVMIERSSGIEELFLASARVVISLLPRLFDWLLVFGLTQRKEGKNRFCTSVTEIITL